LSSRNLGPLPAELLRAISSNSNEPRPLTSDFESVPVRLLQPVVIERAVRSVSDGAAYTRELHASIRSRGYLTLWNGRGG
jgi:hypothetical protein